MTKWESFGAILALAVIGFGFYVANKREAATPMQFNWAMQGIYSQLDCNNQPGKTPYYLTTDTGDGTKLTVFLECR